MQESKLKLEWKRAIKQQVKSKFWEEGAKSKILKNDRTKGQKCLEAHTASPFVQPGKIPEVIENCMETIQAVCIFMQDLDTGQEVPFSGRQESTAIMEPKVAFAGWVRKDSVEEESQLHAKSTLHVIRGRQGCTFLGGVGKDQGNHLCRRGRIARYIFSDRDVNGSYLLEQNVKDQDFDHGVHELLIVIKNWM